MRTSVLILAAAMGTGVMAQGPQLSLGVDMCLPVSNFNELASFGWGPALGVEFPVGSNVGLALQTSYLTLTIQDDNISYVEKGYLIPIQAAFKFYFQDQQEGGYFSANIGVHSNSLTTTGYTIPATPLTPEEVVEGSTENSTDFSWGLGLGYQFPKLDLGARYNHVSAQVDGAQPTTYFGIRAAYLINLGD